MEHALALCTNRSGSDLMERTAGNVKSALRIVSWPALVSRGVPDPFLWPDDASLIAWFDAYYRTIIERDLHALGVSTSPQRMRQVWAMLC